MTSQTNNFFTQLYNLLDAEDSDDEDKNKCLITYEELTDKFVELNCGHKFNYIPLFNDLVNYKKKFNRSEGKNRLKLNQIRCPYCRKIQTDLLPYYDDLGIEKVCGVNEPVNESIYLNKNNYYCKYLTPNKFYNSNEPESETNKPYLEHIKCCYIGTQILVKDLHLNIITNYGDTNYYCYTHKKIMINKYKQETKDKLKLEKKKEKELIKAAQKEEKEKEKEKQKQAKIALKKETIKKTEKQNLCENIVLGPSVIENQIENIGCIKILKTGPNKGKPCGCKIFLDNVCKRHK